jgi:hypothetical protein
MIKSTQLSYEYGKQLNRVNSDFNKAIAVVDRDSYLNHAINILQENYSVIIEVNPSVRDHFRQIELKNIPLVITETKPDHVIAAIPSNYYRRVRLQAVGSKPSCGDKDLRVNIIQSDDLSEALYNPHWKPSFNWEETFADEGVGGFYVYRDNFDIKSVTLDYIRKIPEIATPSLLSCDPKCYVNSSGESICDDQDFLIDSTYVWRKVVNLAVLLTLRDLGQIDDYQTKQNEILFTEKAFLN